MSSGYCARGLDFHHEGIKELLMPLSSIPDSDNLIWFLKQISGNRVWETKQFYFTWFYFILFYLHVALSIPFEHTYRGTDIQVKEAEKLTVLLQCMPGAEPYSIEGYRSSDVHENIRKGRNLTTTSQSRFFPPLMIVIVRCFILHQHLCQNRHHILSPGYSEHPKFEQMKLEEGLEKK